MQRPPFSDVLNQLGDKSLRVFSKLLEDAPFGVYVDHPSRGCIYANQALLTQFGVSWQEFRGFGWARFVVAEDVERIQNAISEFEHNPKSLLMTYRTQSSKEAPVRWISVHAQGVFDDAQNHTATICITRDATRETAQTERLIKEQKVEAIGQLAARLAHDLNNLLTAIIGNTELLGLEVKSEKGRGRLRNIELVFDQAKHLTSQLLTLSQKEVSVVGTISLDAELLRLEGLLQSTAGSGVPISMDLNAQGSHMALNFAQLGQITLNLVSNARDAMGGKGELKLSTRVEQDKVIMAMRDHGCGMDDATLQNAFEPFFTTKETGRGSGLGLATTRDLVERVDGSVTIKSAPNAGTTVIVTFPKVEPLLKKRAKSPDELTARTGTVLIVEDDDAVRQSLGYALALVGYKVVASSSLAEARQRLKQLEELSVVVSDVMLPDGLGTDLVEEIRLRWPSLPVVFNSGFAGDASEQLSKLDSHTAFVAKPFRAREILEAISTLEA